MINIINYKNVRYKMIKNIAWNTFKQTGNINSYLEFKETENIEKNMKVNFDETSKSKWDSYSRK